MATSLKTTITLFIHQLPGKPQSPKTCDMSIYSDHYGPLLGTQEVEVEWQEIDRDPVDAMIGSLEAQVQKERADSQVRVNGLLEKIGKLQCLEYQTSA